MRKFRLSHVGICSLVSVLLLQSCKDDSYLTALPPVSNQSFTEEFDTVSAALNRGWRFINASDPKGSSIWQQGGSTVAPWFAAFSSNGPNVGFIGVDYLSTSAQAGIISNWLVSPAVTFQNGDKISFYTRTVFDPIAGGDSTDYSNRLQLLTNNDNTLNVGFGTETGDFTPVLDINPTYIEQHTAAATYSPLAYPARWTKFEVTINGLNQPRTGRFAFRYFIEGGGSNGLGYGVGIDKVEYKSISK
ncbi:MAG: hypothetical protein JWP88_2265 [Flaviaesturariibacter sp.]|nr:hypothetical protein [Flaviaesturariibacter sp.]